MRIITVVGARPNIIKLDPELKQEICNTGQHWHKNMNDVFFEELALEPKWNLNCKSSDTGKMLTKLTALFKKEKPDMVIVFGDTNSSLAGALAAAQLGIKIAHIEAGLRSYRNMPEEVNRITIDHISTVLLCPTNNAVLNLEKEGLRDNVYMTGDPMFEALGRHLPIAEKDKNQYILLTVHRNFNDNHQSLKSIFDAIKESGERVIFSKHPRIKFKFPKNVEVIKPQGHETMLSLIANAKKVITDSGGVQREAFWLNTPVIILRDETEWPEIISKQAGVLVGTDKDKILEAIKNFKGHLNAPPNFGANKLIRETLYKYL